MPTPVTTARQCLTPEAARALEEAVVLARRRSHAQTTSLHVISSFLSLPSSILRDACTRTRNSSYSSRIQFKALELCFNVALDRLPASQIIEEPPISNSLMAAIKRSQANQRRHPESFHLHNLQQQQLQQQQQQQQQQSSISCVKVEIQQLILSILDDPVVSRVFGDAGFRSTDIKFSILRPPPSLIRYSSSSYPPLFLCNFAGAGAGGGSGSGGDYEPGRRSFSFPFSGFSEHSDGDENCRRIGEILARKKGRNPLLVGVCAKDAVKSFKEIIESGKNGVLPVEISGLDFICIEKEVSELVTVSGGEELLGLKFEELGRLAKSCSGPGVVVSFGDLKGFIEDGSVDATSLYLISKLTKLVEVHGEKLWLMGAASSYETYLRFITKFPTIEKDWDLQLLPITSLRPSMGGYISRPHSLMESFIPFGGFFSTQSDLKGPLGSTYQSFSRCHPCNEKCEQEVSAILTGGCTVSPTVQYQASLPSWLQSAELSTSNGLDLAKAKDDRTVLNTKVTMLQKKWNDICRRLHHTFHASEGVVNQIRPQVFPCIMGFPSVADRKGRVDNHRITNKNASSNESGCKNVSLELQKISPQGVNLSIPGVSKTKNECSPHNLQTRSSKGELSSPRSHSMVLDDHGSPSSSASVTTDLGLGTLYSSISRDPKQPTCQVNKEHLEDSAGCFPTQVDLVNENIPNPQVRSSSCSEPDASGQLDPRDFKVLWKSLKQKVGRQDEATYAVSCTVACCRTGTERRRGASLKGDIWFSFVGPDRIAKKKLAIALAELIFGSRESLICVDLASPDGILQPKTIFDSEEMNGYDLNFRGKTVVDYIAAEIRKKPLSVVFLENVDKADMLVQNCLFQAIKTGKFTDSHGRETGINNAIFAVTSRVIKGNETTNSQKEPTKFLEEKILEAQGWQMQIQIRYDPGCATVSNRSNVLVSSRKYTSPQAFLNKRKLIETLDITKRVHKTSNKYLDLNLPIEDLEATETNSETSDSGGSLTESSMTWLENFFNLVDESVVFEPFDFDALANEVLKRIDESFRNTIGCEGLLEIDSQVMEQILAAAWLSDSRRSLENWVDQVLISSFTEVRQRFNIRAGSVLKLVTCEGLPMQDQAPGVCLPARIVLQC